MNKIIEQLSAEFERMERTIDYQSQVISSMTTPVKVQASTVYGMMGCLNFCRNYPKLKPDDCSWSEIAKYAESGMAPVVFTLGDTKKVTLNDGTTIGVRIIGFNHDLDANGDLIPISFETVETLNDDFQMNGEWSNKGGWEKSALRAKLNGSFFYEMLPDDLRAVIVPCAKTTGVGEGKDKKACTVDKLFILSEQEVFGRKVFSIGGEGLWYEWYKQENTPYAKRKQNGEEDWRWLRSPYGSGATYFCYVDSSGNAATSGASNSNGVAFGFCV